MAKYKPYSYTQGAFIPVHFDHQIQPGTFEFTLNHIMTYTLPTTDLAYGQAPFQDSLAFPVMSGVALISGLVFYPLFILFLGKLPRPEKFTLLILIIVLLQILLITPFSIRIGFLGASLSILAGLIVANRRGQNELTSV